MEPSAKPHLDRLTLDPLPRVPLSDGASGAALNAIPMLGSIGSIVLIATMGGTGSGPGGTMIRFLAAGMFALATVGFVVIQVDRARKQKHRQVGSSRADYRRHLAGVRDVVRATAERQHAELVRRHPPPAALPTLAAAGHRVWERGPEHPDFLQVRYGVRRQPLALELVAPQPSEDSDLGAAIAAERFVAAHRDVDELPDALDLRSTRELEANRPQVRAILCAAAMFHSPDHLRIGLASDPAHLPGWDWLKWLPHVRPGATPDAHLVLIVDGVTAPSTGDGMTVLRIGPGEPPGADSVPVPVAEALARRLAPYCTGDGPTATDDAPDFDSLPAQASGGALCVPIGVDPGGQPVRLDLKESAQGGMGPHGLVVGATGSGKSEFLRTLVLGLAVKHSPDELNLVLVDFKGGATFAGMADLPHTSAVITNLAGELGLVDRMQDALAGEMTRRQELLRAAGNIASLREYDDQRAKGVDLPPLPALLIVVDEFSELLSARPEFVDLFVAIGRLGRSLGLHLLLASQRLEEGRLKGLESHLSYRVGLRTFSAQESRTVLGVPDAYELPSVPGLGYLRSGPGEMTRFRAAYVSGPARVEESLTTDPGPPLIVPFALADALDQAEVSTSSTSKETSPTTPAGPSLLDTHVARLAATHASHRTHQVWLPPLDVAEPVSAQIPDLERDPALGLASRGLRERRGLVVPVGSVDRPREQRRDPLLVDLRGAAGHVAVVGGPRSGKSTLLATLVTSLALAATPAERRFYVIDLGGADVASLAALPHVAGVGGRAEPDVVRRIVAEVTDLIDQREAGNAARDDVFLVVDGWGVIRTELDELEAPLQQIAARGLAHGVHLLTSAGRWSDYRSAVKDLLGTRLELRLGDVLDSQVDRRTAARVPADRPGRGLTAEGQHFLAALPHPAGDIADAWRGPDGPKLRLLPDRIPLAEVRRDAADDPRVVLGIDERRLAPVGVDPATEPHLLVFGDRAAGKTTALRTYLREVLRDRPPNAVQVVLVDYRRSLLGEVPPDHLLHHLSTADQASAALEELATYFRTRLPGPGVTPQQLRERSWWSGAEVFVVVDDYELVATGHVSPLTPLQPLLAQAGDVGLHLVVARRSGGAGRALHEPVLQTLRDLAMPGLVLSGSRDEGPLVGTVRPTPLAPGRGHLVTREHGTQLVQVAWIPPAG